MDMESRKMKNDLVTLGKGEGTLQKNLGILKTLLALSALMCLFTGNAVAQTMFPTGTYDPASWGTEDISSWFYSNYTIGNERHSTYLNNPALPT